MNEPAMNLLIEAALKYARYGWHIFPVYEIADGRCSCGKGCDSPGKHPRTFTGKDEATTDTGQVMAWWQRWPNANIGIATGPSNLVVLDIDPRNGGDETLRSVFAQNGAIETPIALTGGGGEHYYMTASVDAMSRPLDRDKYPGIDVKAKGGYVLAPPSKHISGGTYTWEASSPRKFAPVPQWLVDLMNGNVQRSPIVGADTETVIIAGERNTALARFAGRLRRLGTSVEAITDALVAMNTRQVRPSLSESEVRRIAQSIGRYAPAEVPQNVEMLLEPQAEISGIVDVGDVPDTDDSDMRRYEIGIENIDRGMKRVRPGEFVVVGARQGHGKTAMGETIAIRNSLVFRVLFATLEMKIEDIRDRMISRLLQIPLDDVEAMRIRKDPQYKDGRDMVDSLNLGFYRPTKSALRSSAAVMRAAEQFKADILITDYTRSLSDWQEGKVGPCSEIVENFSMWSKETKTTHFLLSQLNRDAQGKRPIESQLQDTGRLEQEAEKLLLLWRPFIGDKRNDHVCEVIVAKNRRGSAFRGHVHWTGATTSFHSMTAEEESLVMCCERGGK